MRFATLKLMAHKLTLGDLIIPAHTCVSVDVQVIGGASGNEVSWGNVSFGDMGASLRDAAFEAFLLALTLFEREGLIR